MGLAVVLEGHGAEAVHDSVESRVGNTPLLRLRMFDNELPSGVQIHAKAEHLNPGGSVKDRAALSMIRKGETSGKLRPGMTILDATSGNTGIRSEERRVGKECRCRTAEREGRE